METATPLVGAAYLEQQRERKRAFYEANKERLREKARIRHAEKREKEREQGLVVRPRGRPRIQPPETPA